jgi:hypothetical protein
MGGVSWDAVAVTLFGTYVAIFWDVMLCGVRVGLSLSDLEWSGCAWGARVCG